MKRNLPIIVAILLPILVVAGVLLVVYLPSSSLVPEYNLVFAINNDNYPNYTDSFKYSLEEGRIIKVDLEKSGSNLRGPMPIDGYPELYLYDFNVKEVQEISYEKAQDLEILKPGSTSPDGYHIQYTHGGNSGIWEIFGGYDRNYGWEITRDGLSNFYSIEKGEVNSGYYLNGLEILGWIKK